MMWPSLSEPAGLTPHGFCLTWEPGLIWLHAASDAVVGLSYFSIPLAIGCFARQRRDLAYRWVLWFFVAFILACGATHLMAILTLWVPAYLTEGMVKLVAAVTSVGTAVLLWPLVPRLVALPSPAALATLNRELDQRVAAQERTAELLRESEARHRAIYLHMPAPMHTLDAAGRITGVNDRWCHLLGYERKEVIGRQLAAFMRPPLPAAAAAGGPAGARSADLYDVGCQFVTRSGTVLDMLLSTYVEPAAGTPARVLGVLTDVTDRKRAEAEIVRQNSELQLLVDRVQALDAMRTRFFANLSHELRTPLTLILGPVARLLAGEPGLPAAARHDLEVVQRNAATLLGQVNDLLDLAKFDAGRLQAQYAAFDLAALTRRIAAHFDALASQREVAWTVTTPPVLAMEADADKLGRVLFNLLSNAFKFTPARGTIACRLAEQGEEVVLSVEDSGTGVPPAARELIFERFRQGDAAEGAGGSGLGLAIAKDFVNLHGGTIAVDDTPYGGAHFRVSLPRRAPVRLAVAEAAPEVILPQPAPPASAPAERRTDAAEARPCVLVVEDHTDLRQFIAESLSDRFKVVTAADGAAGLEEFPACAPDLVVTDLMMPGLTGDAFLAALRERPDGRDVAVLVLSARSEDALRVRLLEGGAQDYLVKPFSVEELRARAGNLVAVKRARDILTHALAENRAEIDKLAAGIAERNQALQANAERLRAALGESERANAAKARFMRLVSHELRTPLTSLSLSIGLLRRSADAGWGPRQEVLLGRVDEGYRRLAALVGSLLERTRLENGLDSVTPVPFSLASQAQDVVQELRPEAEAKGLRLVLEAPSGLPPLVSDQVLMRRVLFNLIANAIRYTPAGQVTVGVSHEPDGLHSLSVTDTGPGIAREDCERVFEPFVQLQDVSHKHHPGVGLGLALVRDVVAALGGRIELESEPGCGCRFTVRVSDFATEAA